MPKRKPSRRKARTKREPELNQRIKHFEEEVERIGKRFGKRMEKRGEKWEDWFDRNLGVVGPFLSGVLSLVCLGILILIIGFINLFLESALLTNIHSFLVVNMGLFFLLFLFFSYVSYLSRNLRYGYWLFLPVKVAAGITVAFWLITEAINITNLSAINVAIGEGASFISQNLLLIFWVFLVLGYLLVLLKAAAEGCICVERGAGKGYRGKEKYKRLYRSGRNRILGGVCGGIGEYLGVDPVIIRILWIIGTFASFGTGILIYIIAWIIIPRNPKHKWD